MNPALWRLQGDIIGSQLTEKDLFEMTNTGATSNPGTVQIHIDRALAKAAAAKEINRKANCQPCHVDPIVYNIEYHAALTKALALLNVG